MAAAMVKSNARCLTTHDAETERRFIKSHRGRKLGRRHFHGDVAAGLEWRWGHEVKGSESFSACSVRRTGAACHASDRERE